MKRMLILYFISIVLSLNAAIITVDNKYPSIGDFTTLQDAYYATNPGDTIYVYPSQDSYSSISLSKQLTILGAGFGYEYYEQGIHTSRLGGVTLNDGSEYSVIQGLHTSTISIYADYVTIQNNLSYSTITIDADNCLIKQNDLYRITVSENHEGNQIIGNKIEGTADCISVYDNNTVRICNNILQCNAAVNGKCIGTYSNVSIVIANNVLKSNGYAISAGGDCHAYNNIICYGGCSGYIFEYNLSGSSYPSGGSNITGVYLPSVFVDYENEDFHLKAGSPAIDAGHPSAGFNDLDGSRNDMGIYGGPTPYKDIHNKPGIPTIYEFLADEIVIENGTLDVQIKATTGE